MRKSLFIIPLAALMALASCSKDAGPDRAEIDPSKSSFNVGILQYAPADALETARLSFKAALSSSPLVAGKQINYIEKFSFAKDVDDVTYAKSLVASCDIMLGIATPSAIHLKNERDEAGKKQPILFTAVTDPVDAKLAKAFPHHDGSVTGTSDDNPVESQVKLIKKCMPHKEASQIRFGIFYTNSESNSAVQARRAKAAALSEGLSAANIFDEPCTSIADLQAKCTSLCNKIDVLYIPTDNLCASNMNIIKPILDNAHVLCIVGEEGMLNGGHITYSVSYNYLGTRAGEMAAEIISGTKQTHEIDIEKSLDEDDWNKVYNSSNIEDAQLGFTIPADVLADFTDVSIE